MARAQWVQTLFGILRMATAIVTGYECFAILTRKVPTLSYLSKKHWWIPPTLVGALSLHLAWPLTDSPTENKEVGGWQQAG